MDLTEKTFGFIYPQYMAFLRGSLNPAMVVLATKCRCKTNHFMGLFCGNIFHQKFAKNGRSDYPTYGHIIGMVSNHSMWDE